MSVKTERDLTFIKGADCYSELTTGGGEPSAYDLAKKDLNEILSTKNLAFLFGSGCSSQVSSKGEEMGIPTMGPMAQELLAGKTNKEVSDHGLTCEVRESLKENLGIDLTNKEYAGNLERLMEVLFGFQFALSRSTNQGLAQARSAVDEAIRAIKKHVFVTCKSGQEKDSAEEILKCYQTFYRKLAQRPGSLPRPTVATTNYDLFNETAMDRIGTPYINGFMGSVEKRFNPSVYRYTIAQRLDMSSQKWTSLDNLTYLLKLHGSLNWFSADKGLFPIEERELNCGSDSEAMLIYPTPAKQNASFASPYSDIFREFQLKVVQEQSALVVVGYGFGDEHVNNIIYQALTIPTFRLVVLANPCGKNEQIKTLMELKDPRVWVIGTDGPPDGWKAHYFKELVEDLMPAGVEDPAEEAISRVAGMIAKGSKRNQHGG